MGFVPSHNLAASQKSLEPSWLPRVAAVYLLMLSAMGGLVTDDPATASPSARAEIEASGFDQHSRISDTPERSDK